MQKRHEELLIGRLETVVDAGCVHILWNELYRWFEMKKIAAGTYRDLERHWQEVSRGKLGQLKYVEGSSGIFLFAEETIRTVYEGGE